MAPASFDFIVCRAAFKNFAEPIQALSEMYRVLRPGSETFIFDLRREASADAINAHVASLGLGRLNSLLMKWMFKYVLIRRAYSPDQFRHLAAETPFQTCDVCHDVLRLQVSLRKCTPVANEDSLNQKGAASARNACLFSAQVLAISDNSV